MLEEVRTVGCTSALPNKPKKFIHRSDTNPLKAAVLKMKFAERINCICSFTLTAVPLSNYTAILLLLKRFLELLFLNDLQRYIKLF
jgi:hypothetical protein